MNNYTVLSFSSRVDGNCAKISKYISNYHNQTNVPIFNIDSENYSPCNNCDYECLQPGMRCPNLNQAQIEIMDSICNSDLIYFVIPNYCGQPCANYYAFNERCVGYFNMDREKMKQYLNVRKRFIVVSNTEGFEQAMKQQTANDPEILYLKSGKYQKKSIAGDILDSAAARADLDAFLALGTL